ncbi:MAG TPA: 2-oxoacid:acceptor oxidoreductase subunit alpha [Dehalococcoidia bacterium]|nr:2-oxoacid:acceptor oxidoreductase subunit alpha [Dehalococcoidia bacterium]
MTTLTKNAQQPSRHEVLELDRVTIRFAGDSGDGMQLAGTQFTKTSAVVGNDISTLPDFPAEIRAPQGSLPGVSGFQVSFSSHEIYTPGDEPDVLVAMNPAALKTNLSDLPRGGILVVNEDEFTETNLKKAGYEANPLEDGSLQAYRVYEVPISTLNARALEESGLTPVQIDRAKNMFALGLMFWMYSRPLDVTIRWIEEKFGKNPQVAQANITTLKAGYHFGETTEMFATHYHVPKAPAHPGTYRNITGNEATALGLVTASKLAGRPLLYASYPITPASDVLHELAAMKRFGVRTLQAEDEISAVGAAIGAAFGGSLGTTGTSGPGFALKSEAIGLAVMVELPLVVLDIQRAGPSTGMPTKMEQGDLLQAMFGRNGESPVAIIAPATVSDCFSMVIEAWRIAIKYRVPVIFLSDAYLGMGSEPWLIPSFSELAPIDANFASDPETFQPYLRDEQTMARPWAIPGTPGLEHRIGGLEKAHISGTVNYQPDNHDLMVHLRAEKVQRIVQDVPDVEVDGDESGELLVLGWGSTYGAITSAVQRARAEGKSVSAAHLRYLNPLPANLGEVLGRYKKVLIPENNLGQLQLLVRGRYLVDAVGLNKASGRPFTISEVEQKIDELLS